MKESEIISKLILCTAIAATLGVLAGMWLREDAKNDVDYLMCGGKKVEAITFIPNAGDTQKIICYPKKKDFLESDEK
jgi:hypothetical protein